MTPHLAKGPYTRAELLRRYVQLQRDLIEGDPSSSSYQGTISAFRQMGHSLITSGCEEDLDRLLRIRVIDGGRSTRLPRRERVFPEDIHVLEVRPTRFEDRSGDHSDRNAQNR